MPSFVPRLVLVPALLLAACATKVHELPRTYVSGALPETVVIGRLDVELGPTNENVEPPDWVKDLTHMRLTVHNESTDESYEIVCDEGGYHVPFHVALPPGDYTLKQFKVNNLESYPSGTFTVPSGGTVYIGTLRYARGS